MKNKKITEQFANEFDHKCAINDAHRFDRFVTSPRYNGESLLSVMARVEDVIKCERSMPDKEAQLDEQKIKEFVIAFYKKYLPNVADEAEQILNGTHPYFIDSDGDSHVNFIEVNKDDRRTSYVGHNGKHTFLDFNVYSHGQVEDLRTTAHELSHALSAHHQHLIKMIRSDTPQKQIDEYTNRAPDRDGIGEIESYIVEKLFNHYLVSEGIYNEENIINYRKAQTASLLSEINLMREEHDIISELSCPVTQKSLEKLYKKLERSGQKKHLDRIDIMHNDRKRSRHMFRYFVGRIVADKWMKMFMASDQQTKQEMLNKFQEYLKHTHELNIDSACEFLVGENFVEVVNDYIESISNSQKGNSTRKR